MIKSTLFFLSLGMIFLTACNSKTGKKADSASEKPAPNIIYILADDLGYGDLSCYGQEKFTTPNIDRLAEEGMKFTRHYSGSTVCAPSRSSLLTGLHTGHTPIRGNMEIQPEGQAPLPSSAVTLPEVLKNEGYISGAFGKWGLGYPGSEGDPVNQGFDVFFGYNCQRQAHRYYPEHLWHNKDKVMLEGNDLTKTTTYAPDVIHEKVLDFIDSSKDQPFFLYYPIIQPHAEILVPDDSIFRRYLGRYPEKPFVGAKGADYGPNMEIGKYASQEYPRATFAAMIIRVDLYVGDIMKKLEEYGLEENTVVIFTSDNGPHMEGGADPDFFDSNGPLRGHKRDLYEGGIRVPFIAKWKGNIPANTVTDHISAFWDMMPTFTELAGIEFDKKTDGISLVPVFMNEEKPPKHDYLYWEFHEHGGKQAILKDNWKAIRLNVRKNPDGKLELYNLENDPGEKNNIAEDYPELVKEFAQLMEESRTQSDKFNFGLDTYKGE